MSNRNNNLRQAEKNKRDEFYTQLKDIKDEMQYYKPHFENKVIYMNADHPDYSNFWQYFKSQFNDFKIKKIISTFWSENGKSFKTVYDGDVERRTPLKGDGDFRSDECIAILKKSDIIITNPPFSLFRELIDLLIDYEKHFIILGNNNSITTKEIFPLIKRNKMWLGMKSNATIEFEVPDNYSLNKNGRIDSNGRKYLKVPAITWFTNLDYPKHHEDLLLWASYEDSEHEYLKYDNYGAINVNRVADIPYDYEGVMGVPISFMGKWNPNQFEIIGLGVNNDFFTPSKLYINPMKHMGDKVCKCGSINQFLMINVKDKPNGVYYTADNVEGYLTAPYARILIRNRRPSKIDI